MYALMHLDALTHISLCITIFQKNATTKANPYITLDGIDRGAERYVFTI
jgi:hypothetical protein